MTFITLPELIPTAYPALEIEPGVFRFPDWPELARVEGRPPLALARAIRLRQQQGLAVPYASQLSTLPSEALVSIPVMTEAEAVVGLGPMEEQDG